MQEHGRREQPGLLWWPVLELLRVHSLRVGVAILPGVSELLSWTDASALRCILAS